MTDQEQIKQLKEANETWRKQWASERYEVEQLKAQVNCLREIVSKVNKPIFIFEQSVREEITRSLEATTGQCLAEHDARVIEQLKTRFSFWIRTSPKTHIYVEDKESDGVFDSFPQFLKWYAKELRGQANKHAVSDNDGTGV